MLPSEGEEDLDDKTAGQQVQRFQTLHRPSQHYEQADSSEREREREKERERERKREKEREREKQREAKNQARTI